MRLKSVNLLTPRQDLLTSLQKSKKQREIWWTVRFDHPAPRVLLCSTNEVGEMKICAMEHRDKYEGLTKQIGNEFTVEWTDMDQASTLNGSQMTLRNCILMQFLASSQRYLLRFRCGYEKLVTDNDLVCLLEESAIHRASRKKRKSNLVALADAEQHTITNLVPPSPKEGPTPVSGSSPLEPGGDIRAEELLQKKKLVLPKQ